MSFVDIWNQTLLFLYSIFTFGISKIELGNLLGLTFETDTSYYVLLIGLWVALLVLIWFMLWMFFKTIKVII